MFILIPVGFIILGGIIFMAVWTKSDFKVRIAALTALALMILTVIICLFLVFFSGKPVEDVPVVYDPNPLPPPPASSGNIFILLGFILFLIVLFVVVLLISLRENRKRNSEPSASPPQERLL
jgi:cytochrome bd-type quinol oxidase subunit 2